MTLSQDRAGKGAARFHAPTPSQIEQHERDQAARGRMGAVAITPRVRLMLLPPTHGPETVPDRPLRKAPDARDFLIVATPKFSRTIMEAWANVSLQHGISINDLRGEKKTAALVLARHDLMWRMSKELSMSYAAIGRKLNRDQSTVRYGVAKHEERMRAAQE